MAKHVIRARVNASVVGDLGRRTVVDDQPLDDDGWGVAIVNHVSPMIQGGLTRSEVHWYANVTERRYGPERHNRFGSIFVTAEGIYVRDSTLNMARLPMARWDQMTAVWHASRSGKNLVDVLASVLTHQWVRRPEDGGARLIRDHLDLIEPPEVKETMDKLRAAAAADRATDEGR